MISGRDAAFIRRITNLPRSIAEGVSRAVGQGMNMFGYGRRDPGIHHPSYEPGLGDGVVLQGSVTPEEWVFLTSFEQEYGSYHPFFYACRFMEALKMAEADKKFMFVYLHSPEHPLTPSFCCDTLCSELVVQYLDANFVSWGALANGVEGLQMGSTLRAETFPFCAVVVPVPGDSIAVLQQVEGPVTPSELVEILQRTVEEQGSAFMNSGTSQARTTAAEFKRIREDRRLREEQDAAYNATLLKDKERDRIQNVKIQGARETEKGMANAQAAALLTTKQAWAKPTESKGSKLPCRGANESSMTQIQVRFPNGERREKRFNSSEKIESIYRYIDSLNLPGIGSYRLISNFPRRVYGFEQLNMTLRDAGLIPRASLFLELV